MAMQYTNEREPLTAAVARRLRGLMAEIRLNQTQVAERTGWGRMYLSRRLSGQTPMDTSDLETIEAATSISVAYLITGEGPRMVGPDHQPPPTSGLWISSSAAA